MIPDTSAAQHSLQEESLRRRQVQAAGPDERRIALAWAAVVLVFVPLYDALDYPLASTLMVTAAALAFLPKHPGRRARARLHRDRELEHPPHERDRQPRASRRPATRDLDITRLSPAIHAHVNH